MGPTACSLQIMDVRLLKTFISAMQGGPIPDLKAEVDRRCHYDIVLNWSRRIIRAAAPLEQHVPRERWTLYTQFRPFFITTDDPEHAATLVERFLQIQNLEEILNLFREEVARIDAERADEIIEIAKKDKTPGMIDLHSPDQITSYYRAYLLYERRQLEALAQQATTEQLVKAGHLLAWRTSTLLANFHPTWYTRNTSLTSLASRRDLGLEKFVADPRGMYAEISSRISGLHSSIPFNLSKTHQTGLCIVPKSIQAVLDLMDGWPQPILPHPTFGVPTPGEVQALREALIYSLHRNSGIWESADLVVPERDLYARVQQDQADREENPEKYAQAATPTESAPEEKPISSSEKSAEDAKTGSSDEQNLETVPAEDTKKSWLKKLLNH